MAFIRWAFALLLVVVAGLALWLWQAPPALVRIGAGYTAKAVCSGVFVSGRAAEEVLRVDVQAPGHPILRLMRVTVDREAGIVRADLAGFAGGGIAVAREGTGCAGVPDGDIARARAHRAAVVPSVAAPALPWPQGEATAVTDPGIQGLLADAALAGPGMRALVVVRDGAIVAERYAPGFDSHMPLQGWSMTKTVNAVLFGMVARERRIGAERAGLFDVWRGDARAGIAIADLLSMSSGLAFDEGYGGASDVTRMLYLEADMARYAAARPQAQPLGKRFAYSSGSAVLIARIWQDALANPARALGYPREALFGPLGMHSAVLEADARGTFVGSSYMYATAHDWARFALFLLDDGVWRGLALLPSGYVANMRTAGQAAPGRYGRGQVWLHGPRGATPEGTAADAGFDLPDDTFWMLGHDGQSIALVPSRKLALVRLGLTPAQTGYKPQGLLQAVLAAKAGIAR